MEHVNRMFDQANLVELPPSYEARQDPARMLVLVFFLLFPGVCMTIVAGVMLSDTVEWARWQRRVPGFMRFMETALRWRTIPFCVLGAATGVLAVAVVRQYLDVNNRFAQCHPLEDGDCAGILAMAPILFTLAVGSILSTSCCFLAGCFRMGEPKSTPRAADATTTVSSSGDTAWARKAASEAAKAYRKPRSAGKAKQG